MEWKISISGEQELKWKQWLPIFEYYYSFYLMRLRINIIASSQESGNLIEIPDS
jgi:hypothetical protein